MPNLYANFADRFPEEWVSVLAEHPNVRIERIVSMGHSSPPGFWYDQDENEWLVVLKGKGEIQWKDGESVVLKSGDHLWIPAHKKHRVASTAPDEPTVWLAVFYRD